MIEQESKTVSGKQAISYRNYRRARDRALVRLTHAYPDTYRQLLAEEKAFDEVNGKKWVGITGSTNLVVGIHTRANGAVGIIGAQATDTSGIVAKLIVAVAADAESLTIAMLVIPIAILVGDVYKVVLEVAAAPLYKVIAESATIYIPFVTRIVVCKN